MSRRYSSGHSRPVLKSVCHGSAGRSADAARAEQIELVAQHAIGGGDDRAPARPGSARGTRRVHALAVARRQEERRCQLRPPERVDRRRARRLSERALGQHVRIDARPRPLQLRRAHLDQARRKLARRLPGGAPARVRRIRSLKQETGQHGGDASGGLAVPQLGDPLRRRRGERLLEAGDDVRGPRADDAVGAVGDGDRPLGVLAQRQARECRARSIPPAARRSR